MNVVSMTPPRRPTLLDRLLARPGCESPWTTVLHLVLILTWPAVIFCAFAAIVLSVESRAEQFWSARGFNQFVRVSHEFYLPEAREDRLVLATIMLSSTLLLLAGGWLIHWLIARRETRSFRAFLRRTWRATLTCLVLAPCLVYVLMILPPPVNVGVMPMFVLSPVCAFLPGPGVVAVCERRRRQVSPHRPACPDCGYSLQHMIGLRCPECGGELPTARRTYRRWAHRRLRWDRTDRGMFPAALLATAARVLVRPAAAGASVCVPDRFGRAIRWAAACIFLVCIVGALAQPVIELGFAATARIFGPPQPYRIATGEGPSLARQLLWHTQSLLAWIIVVCAYPAVAFFLIGLMPGIGRAARRTLTKWTLYATAAIPLGYAIALTVDGTFLRSTPWFARLGLLTSLLNFPYYISRPPELFVAIIYGWIWAAGVSANRWIDRRGCETCLIAFAAYVIGWWVVAVLAFRPGALMGLL